VLREVREEARRAALHRADDQREALGHAESSDAGPERGAAAPCTVLGRRAGRRCAGSGRVRGLCIIGSLGQV
jgi:hypothetical protein